MRAAYLLVLSLACSPSDVTRTPTDLATPERTVQTFLASYGVGGLDRGAVAQRAASNDGFDVVDAERRRRAVADLDGAHAEALAGYVLGMLAASQHDLRYETFEDHAYVSVGDGARVVLERGDDRGYRIVLARSVPPDVQEGLRSLSGRERTGDDRR